MKTRFMGLFSLSLVALLACSVNKGGDTDDTSTGSTGSSGGSSDSSSGGGSESTTGSGSDSTTGDATTGSTSANPTSSTGNATGGEDGLTPCIDTPTVLAPGDATPLGVSADELLADKLGERVTTLTFYSEPTSLSDAWKGKQLPLTVTLRYEGGEVRWVDSEPDPDWMNPGTEGGFPGECEDRLEIDVELDFVTEAGEFDEHPQATLLAFTADRADLQVSLIPPGLSGSLDLGSIYMPGDPEWVIQDVVLAGTWAGDLAGGSVLNEVLVGGEDGFIGFGPLASWGDEIEP